MKDTNSPSGIVPKAFRGIFAMLVACFALWGVLNNMTDNLVPAFQKIFMTSQSTAGYVQISFYGAYSAIALFASLLIEKAGYRVGVLAGLGGGVMKGEKGFLPFFFVLTPIVKFL